MIDSYFTISEHSVGQYKEKGSKFIAHAIQVDSEDSVKEELLKLRKTYFDARHHCYAYVLGEQADRFRANDDGEPGHSAGDPILGQIRSRDLTNTLVVVVRYFGGTKLGVSGLISAYKDAAASALDANRIVSKLITKRIEVKYPYDSTNEIMRIISDLDLKIAGQNYEADCTIQLDVVISKQEMLLGKLKLLQDMNHPISLSIK